MATKDGFDPDDALPLILSADESEPGTGSDRAVISLRFVMAIILVVTATTIGISIPSVRNPVTLSADVTASVDSSAPQPSTDESMPSIQPAVIQSTADAEALQTAKDVPASEISASEPASQTPAENSEASSETLFKEFQAWSAEQDARDSAKPVQDDPAPVAENVPASVRPIQKPRRARTVRSARADIIRHVQKRGANIRRQNERAQARPVQDARAQTQPMQYAEPPSFLERLNPFGASRLQR
jgi:hypothetical protein